MMQVLPYIASLSLAAKNVWLKTKTCKNLYALLLFKGKFPGVDKIMQELIFLTYPGSNKRKLQLACVLHSTGYEQNEL